jgi:hypothetical protein
MKQIRSMSMKTFKRHHESGIAMLIVIMALLVVTAVAAGMMIYSTSEVKVDANYRDEQVALFAAKAGLEEARDRMLSSNANFLTLPTVVPGASGESYATYIVSSTSISPWTNGNSVYSVPTFDSEFMCEITAAGCSATSFPNSSTCCTSTTTITSYSGPASNQVPYQWVRVNLKTNYSIDASTGTGRWVNSTDVNASDQVYFDSQSSPPHECVASSCPAGDAVQPVYELTSYAVTPSGTIRMLQDDVAAFTFNLNLKSPLSIPGTVGSFSGGNSVNYQINGNDGQGSAPAVAGCTPNGPGGPAVSVSSSSSANVVQPGLPRPANYTGTSCTYDSGSQGCIGNATLPTSVNSPAQLDQTLSTIEQNANACLGCSTTPGTYSFSNISAALPGGTWPNAATNPQIVYVNGNLDISGSNTGSGILVVTGNLTYDGNSSWNGIILVVGQGTTTYNVNGGGNGQFNGAIMVATTKDANGNELANFGTSDFNINGGGGSGIFYNSCWVNNVQKPTSYVVLSSKEISQ